VRLETRHRLAGIDEARVPIIVDSTGARIAARADVHVLALGGASWPRLGSDGQWADTLCAQGIEVRPFLPANCGFETGWSQQFALRFAGTPLKTVSLSFAGLSVRGEAMITQQGIEGGAVYALSARLRDAILAKGEAILVIDLRPDVEAGELAQRLARPRQGQSTSSFLRKAAGLSAVAIAALREVRRDLPPEPSELASLIKSVPLRLSAPRPIARAISSAGGIAFSEVNEGLMLKKLPGIFVCGEMLDWEAPTGGYLLQASFATGAAAGRAAALFAA
jgi:uncharacterized flavoprotein (TIGR03862 family)